VLSFCSLQGSTHLDTYLPLRPGDERSSMWRHIIMCSTGGVYTDADTWCVKPIKVSARALEDMCCVALSLPMPGRRFLTVCNANSAAYSMRSVQLTDGSVLSAANMILTHLCRNGPLTVPQQQMPLRAFKMLFRWTHQAQMSGKALLTTTSGCSSSIGRLWEHLGTLCIVGYLNSSGE
jgi:hypothetical protein